MKGQNATVMKTLWICCFTALCLMLSGCAGLPQRNQQEESPNQRNVPQEELDEKTEVVPQEEDSEIFTAPDAAAEDDYGFAGKWRASDSSQCYIDIKCGDDGSYAIEAIRSGDSQETAVWVLTGTYDEIWEGIDYIGAKYEEVTDENGNVERVPVPEREEVTGLIFFKRDGVLNWEEIFDHAGDGLDFVKE